MEKLDEDPAGSTWGSRLTVFSPPFTRRLPSALKTIDATCPLVTKVHNEARRFADEGDDILLMGDEGHGRGGRPRGEALTTITLVQSTDDVGEHRRP